MSRLFKYANLDAAVRLRVDSDELLPWAADLHSSAIESNEPCPPGTEAELAWTTASSDKVQIELNGVLWEEPMSIIDVFFQSENLLTQLFAYKLNQRIQIHSATVRRPDGGAWLICGPSRAGKTSVTLSLMLGGWSWMTDELTLVDEETPSRVNGFRRNFNLKESSWELFPETRDLKHARECWSGHHQSMIRFIDPEILRPNSFVAHAELEGILLPVWEPDGPACSLERISGVAATQTLMPEIKFPSPAAFRLIASWMRSVPVHRFRHFNPRAIAEAMEKQRPWLG